MKTPHYHTLPMRNEHALCVVLLAYLISQLGGLLLLKAT